MRRLETFDWWPELLGLKDSMSLRELAAKFDVTAGAISAALRREGINRSPAPPGPRHVRSKAADDLPPEPGEAPAKSGAPRARSHSKDARLLALWDELGKLPDRDVAEKAGISVRTVASFRARNKIPAYTGPRKPRGARAAAKVAVASAPAARGRRARRGATAGGQAWSVVVRSAKGDVTRVVIADTLVDAAGTAAARASGGKVVSVSWVGELL